MSTASQHLQKPANPFAVPFVISGSAMGLLLVVFLVVFGVSLVPIALAAGIASLIWVVLRYPLQTLGVFLAFVPIYTLVFLLAKFFGPPYIAWLQGSDRAALLVLVAILWKRNGITLTTADWALLTCFALATLRMAFGGELVALLTDFSFIIAYAAGRVTVLSEEQERRWAVRGIWIIAVLAVLGMIEVFYIGEGPRTVLYLSAAPGGTQAGELNAAFHAEGYSGLRESSTMFGPLQFAPLCMCALIIWWVYCRRIIPAAMVAAGLICSVTRSAWVGTAVAITTLAMRMSQTKRLLLYVALGLGLFVAAIPTLGLGDYLFSTKTGQDPSAQGHKESIFDGLQYAFLHPLGVGPGNAGRFAVVSDYAAAGFESTYLTLSAEYGLPTVFCFVGFLASILVMLRRERTPRAYAAIGIVVGFGMVMMFAALHDVFPLACWLWFPVGMAVRSASAGRLQHAARAASI